MIKTLIFDFGDVFLDLDKSATIRALEKFKVDKLSEELLRYNLEYEKGLISSEEFINIYCKAFPLLTPEDFMASWNSILLKLPEHRLNFLKKLSREGNFTLILLSNTNDIHIDWVKHNISFFEDFKNCFHFFYFSQEINLRKPDRSIFEYVLHRHQLKPAETLFIDDTVENTLAAEKLDIHTWNLNPEKEDVTELFQVKSHLF